MSSVSFANKLFNRLDNCLLYDEDIIYEMKEIDVSKIPANYSIQRINIYNDKIYFVSNENYKEVKQIDINNDDHDYTIVKTVNNNISGNLNINNDDIYYATYITTYTGVKTTLNETTETEINGIIGFLNINSNNQILFNYRNNGNDEMYISNLNDITNSQKWKKILTSTDLHSYINNKYYIYRANNNGKIQVNIKDIITDETTSINIKDAYYSSYCFANDTIFGYLNINNNKVYILSVADFETAPDKSALSFIEVDKLVDVNCFYITNKWFVNGIGKKIYYCPVEYLYNPEHKTTQQITQMNLLYRIDKKLDTLADLLEQFKVPQN